MPMSSEFNDLTKWGLTKSNYILHPRYEEYVAKGGLNEPTWEDYECFVEWITRPPHLSEEDQQEMNKICGL